MLHAKPVVAVIRAGVVNYRLGLSLQKYFSKKPIVESDEFENVLLLLQHEPVYTIGIRTKDYTEKDEQRLRRLGAHFYRTNRGGLITFHGPGQLVAYPIINLKQFHLTMRQYIHTLEETVIDTVRNMGVSDVTRTADTGIWVGDHKICAIGVHGARYVTTHGIGLNCNTDLTWFEHIVPCGIEGKGVTSLSKELQRDVTVEETTSIFTKSFKRIFNCDLRPQHDFHIDEITKELGTS